MARAPHYERADLLVMIVNEAMWLTSEPIDEVSLGDDASVRVRAGDTVLTGRYSVAKGRAIPGPVPWVVEFDPLPVPPRG